MYCSLLSLKMQLPPIVPLAPEAPHCFDCYQVVSIEKNHYRIITAVVEESFRATAAVIESFKRGVAIIDSHTPFLKNLFKNVFPHQYSSKSVCVYL